MKASEKKLCVIQMTYTDVTPHIKEYNAIKKIKSSNIFDYIILAVPDIKENRVLNEFAEEFGIDIFFGDVNNVTKRICDIANKYGCEIIARILVSWFFINKSLINNMVSFIEKDPSIDYVNLPRNFDIRFGADVFRITFLEKILKDFEKDKGKEEKYKFNPWGYAEIYQHKFNIATFLELPTYDKKRFQELKDTVAKVWPERFDHTNSPIFPYNQAKNLLNNETVVLDVACGLGSGTSYLAKQAKKVIGVDISEETINMCKNKYLDQKNIKFINKDIYELNFNNNYFDLIISIHTMEHLPDEQGFLERINNWLKPDGIVIIEVPLSKDYPFKEIDEPFRKGHIREYKTDEFINLLKTKFIIEITYGVTRNFYTDVSKARDSVMVIARKKNMKNNKNIDMDLSVKLLNQEGKNYWNEK